jgi:hypothetical protein
VVNEFDSLSIISANGSRLMGGARWRDRDWESDWSWTEDDTVSLASSNWTLTAGDEKEGHSVGKKRNNKASLVEVDDNFSMASTSRIS